MKADIQAYGSMALGTLSYKKSNFLILWLHRHTTVQLGKPLDILLQTHQTLKTGTRGKIAQTSLLLVHTNSQTRSSEMFVHTHKHSIIPLKHPEHKYVIKIILTCPHTSFGVLECTPHP